MACQWYQRCLIEGTDNACVGGTAGEGCNHLGAGCINCYRGGIGGIGEIIDGQLQTKAAPKVSEYSQELQALTYPDDDRVGGLDYFKKGGLYQMSPSPFLRSLGIERGDFLLLIDGRPADRSTTDVLYDDGNHVVVLARAATATLHLLKFTCTL